MKRTYWKLFALLLAICIMVSCTPSVPEEPVDDTQPPIEEPAQTLEFSLTKDFVIVRPDVKQAQEVEALQLLGRGLQSANGIRFSKGTDYDENECEILIGNTSREASQTASEGLSYMDWTYEVVSDKKIVVCGGSPESTLTAVRAFLREVFGYEENQETQEVEAAGSTATLTVGTKVVYRHEYAVTSFHIGAHEISEYTLVSFDKKSAANDVILDHFRRLTGKQIPVVAADEYQGGPAIFFGMAR